MSSQIDRALEKSRRKKAVRVCFESWKKEYRKKFKVPATEQQCRAAKTEIARAFDVGATVSMGHDGAPLAISPPALQGARLPATTLPPVVSAPSTRAGLTGHGKAPLIASPEDMDPQGPRAAYHNTDIDFHAALERGDRAAALECVPLMISHLLAAAGITNPIVEAPGMMKVLCEFTDILNGRGAQLFQPVPIKPGRKKSMKPASQWMSIVALLICGAMAEKLRGLSKEKALVAVIEDLERSFIMGNVNDYLTESGQEAASSPDARRTALAHRLRKHHGEDLMCKDPGPREIANLYRNSLNIIRRQTAAELAAHVVVGKTVAGGGHYELWLATTANLLRSGRPHAEWRIAPKAGKTDKGLE